MHISTKYTRNPLLPLLAITSLVCVLLLLLPATHASVAGASFAPLPEGTEPLPAGAHIETVLENMEDPVAFAFDPAGRIFYTEKASGNVRLFANGELQTDPVIKVPVSSCSDRGLLGIAIDPNFTANHYIYIYYTEGTGCAATQNTLARFFERDGKGTELEQIFAVPQVGGPHEGGNLHFGPDGKLYVTTGDGGEAANGQLPNVVNSKILRLNSDGTAPADNPRLPGDDPSPFAYAMGFRNPFDFTFDTSAPGRLFASENGPDCDDEMNRIEAGNNYGWRNLYPCDDEDDTGPDPFFNTIKPLWFVPASQCCEAPTGITFYTGSKIPEWHNQLFMSTYITSKLRHFYLNGDHTALDAVKTVEGVSATLGLVDGPDGALYYIEAGGNQAGTLKRIVGAEQTPTPTEPPTPTEQPATATPLPPTATPTPNPVPTEIATVPGDGNQQFPETGKTVSGIFLDYWKQNGGLAQQGYPISDPFNEVNQLDGKTYTVQYFERAVFEYHPEQTDPKYKVLLSLLGNFRYKAGYGSQGAPTQTVSVDNALKFAETGHSLGGKFRTYWEAHGGLAQQGYPISDEFQEKNSLDGKTYTVQYFERAVFELHPENAGTPYEVLLSQLGTFRYKEKYPSK